MLQALLRRLLQLVKDTASAHRKKLAVFAVLVIGFTIAKKRLRTHHVISTVMFFVKLSSKVVSMLPTPVFASYRSIMAFTYQEQEGMPELIKAMNISEIIPKIKNKAPGSVEELTFCVITGVVLNLVLYNPKSLFQLAYNKYFADFESLGAATSFQNSFNRLKEKYLQEIPDLKIMITSQLYSKIKALEITESVNIENLKQIFSGLVDQIFLETGDVHERVLSKRISLAKSEQYKVADNFFRTTKEYIPETPSKSKKVVSQVLNVVGFPFTTLYNTINAIFRSPEQELTPLRYFCTEYLYVLGVKKFRDEEQWPNVESKYLFDMVLEELTTWFSSINFSILLRKSAELKLEIFINRLEIYYARKAKSQNTNVFTRKQSLKALLSVFYKIAEEELSNHEVREKFYERQLYTAFKNMKGGAKKKSLEESIMHNHILQEIYDRNQVEHLDRDMQAKFFNERDGIMIQPVARNTCVVDEKDDIQQLLEAFEMTKTKPDGQQEMEPLMPALAPQGRNMRRQAIE